jgi:hypothetical protein
LFSIFRPAHRHTSSSLKHCFITIAWSMDFLFDKPDLEFFVKWFWKIWSPISSIRSNCHIICYIHFSSTQIFIAFLSFWYFPFPFCHAQIIVFPRHLSVCNRLKIATKSFVAVVVAESIWFPAFACLR